MVLTLKAACGCTVGNGREHNEDNFYFDKKHLPQDNNGLKYTIISETTTREVNIFAVFDGMGGEARGEQASCSACEVFAEELKKTEELVISGKEYLLNACHAANNEVERLAKQNHVGAMGTTVAALFISQNEIFACNVGDSKIFRIRNNQMIQISEDHTDEKIIRAMKLQKKPVLLQYIGVPDTEMLISPFVTKGELQEDDIYVLCTDGITDVISINEVYETIKRADSLEGAVNEMIKRVNETQDSDNATIIIIEFCK